MSDRLLVTAEAYFRDPRLLGPSPGVPAAELYLAKLDRDAKRRHWQDRQAGIHRAPPVPLPRPRGLAEGAPPVPVFVDGGRWVAACPHCAARYFASFEDPRFFCVSCATPDHTGAAVEARALPLAWPEPETIDTVEQAVRAQVGAARFAHWWPGRRPALDAKPSREERAAKPRARSEVLLERRRQREREKAQRAAARRGGRD